MPVVLSKTLTKNKLWPIKFSTMGSGKWNSLKTDIVIFRSPRKQITKKTNFRLSGQKFRQKTCTKYLGILLDEDLLLKDHINTLKQKLNRANDILAKLRHHLPSVF